MGDDSKQRHDELTAEQARAVLARRQRLLNLGSEPLGPYEAEHISEALGGGCEWSTPGGLRLRFKDGAWQMRGAGRWIEVRLPTTWSGWLRLSDSEGREAPEDVPQVTRGLTPVPDYSVERVVHTLWETVRYLEENPGRGHVVDACDEIVTLARLHGTGVTVATEGSTGRFAKPPFKLRAIPKAPEVEPRIGVELRRWTVAHPGRGVRVDGGRLATWWDDDLCDFYTADGEPASIDDYMSGVPERGTWDEPAEGGE